MKRLGTAAVLVPIALAAIFNLPGWAFFLLVAILLEWAAFEYAALGRCRSPQAPWGALLLLTPLAAAGLAWGLTPGHPVDGFHALALVGAVALPVGVAVLLSKVPIEETHFAAGAIGFGVAYFAVPIASLYRLQQHDPWVLFLLLAIVWLGDTAAYYVGTAWGRHKLAPVVSPKKSWEGAAAGLATSILATAIWSVWRRGELDLVLVGIGAATAVASQAGDLVESLWKRGVGVKDSGGVLPGHGGILDRIDSLTSTLPLVALGAVWLAR